MSKKIYKYNTCCKCGVDKKINTHTRCNKCRQKYSYIKCCKCGVDKIKSTSSYCKTCYSKKYKHTYKSKCVVVVSDKINKYNGCVYLISF